MKHNFLSLIVACCLLFVASCTVIPEDERIIHGEIDYGTKSVLLVEFTGWKCVNCPDAAKVAHQLLDLHGDNLVVVGMHPDGSTWTVPSGTALDFRTEAAGVYWTHFGSPVSFPIGVIDFHEFNGSYLLDRNLWASSVSERRQLNQVAQLALQVTAANNDLTIQTTVSAESDADIIDNVSLILWITEDNIVGLQLEGSEPNPEYVHNHVFRAAVTPEWGVDITVPTVENPSSYDTTFTLQDGWVANNCNVVAVLIDKQTKEVLTVKQVPVVAATE
ncbi:MAG: Omp28 family outer membrane lipoprotein [Bacteroidales bacterium]|nr:Omp28 family outer membrane lipoprotein [Bacteroidales bacterium]